MWLRALLSYYNLYLCYCDEVLRKKNPGFTLKFSDKLQYLSFYSKNPTLKNLVMWGLFGINRTSSLLFLNNCSPFLFYSNLNLSACSCLTLIGPAGVKTQSYLIKNQVRTVAHLTCRDQFVLNLRVVLVCALRRSTCSHHTRKKVLNPCKSETKSFSIQLDKLWVWTLQWGGSLATEQQTADKPWSAAAHCFNLDRHLVIVFCTAPLTPTPTSTHTHTHTHT